MLIFKISDKIVLQEKIVEADVKKEKEESNLKTIDSTSVYIPIETENHKKILKEVFKMPPAANRTKILNRGGTSPARATTMDKVTNIWRAYLESDCILSTMQIQRLGDHKYAAQDVSWLDEL
uniref:Uncharacterized protein n=1 Tax=Panagrolaimus sp. ES5 TaxID=591445 RepID=A0AC34FFQ6_9BILA